MYIVMEDEGEFEIIEEIEMDKKDLKSMRIAEEDQAAVELSINSVVGLSNPGTIKIRGEMKIKEVVNLVDCGATHNFISENW